MAPRFPANQTLAAKVERPVLDRLREVAQQNDRTLSGQIRRVLRAWAEGQQPRPPERADVQIAER